MSSITATAIHENPLTQEELEALDRLSRKTFDVAKADQGKYGWHVVTSDDEGDAEFLFAQGVIMAVPDGEPDWATLSRTGIERARVTVLATDNAPAGEDS